MTRHLTNETKVAPERSGPFTITLTDGSYIQWDKNEVLYRVAYYNRKTAKGFYLREALATAMKKQPYSRQVNEILEYLQERDEYVSSLSA